jgi:pyruvate formate lyase activating enzyme
MMLCLTFICNRLSYIRMETSNLDGFGRLANYQEQLLGNVVRCLLCPHNCRLEEGDFGICKVRVNSHGVLNTVAYGNPCSISVDPIEKKPLFHFYPGSEIYSLAVAGCNFHCLNCQNYQISQSSPVMIRYFMLSPLAAVDDAIARNLKLIAFTYTEPTVFYEYVYDTAKLAHERGIKAVLVSNGYINPKPLLDLCPYIDAANIDLKCFDEQIYKKLTGGKLEPVLKTLQLLKENDVWLEITNLLVPGFSDDEKMIIKMCNYLVENGFEDTPLHFTRFYPTYKLTTLLSTPEKSLTKAKEIAERAGIRYVYVGNDSFLDAANSYCPYCKQLLIERKGFVVLRNFIQFGCCRYCGCRISGVWD